METLHAALTLGELAAHLKQKQQQQLKVSEEEPESNYADLRETNTSLSSGTKTNGTKTVKVTFTGEGNQLAVFRWKDPGDAKDSSSSVKSEFTEGEEEQEELSYTEMRLGNSLHSEDDSATPTVDAESHYITTHEIQLTELDHDVDFDFGRGSRWGYDDDNLVYSFVDYASFESVNEDGIGAKSIQRSDGQTPRPPKLAATEAPVSTESEPCEGTSSDESPYKVPDDRLCSSGQVHMAVKTSQPLSGPEEENFYFRTAQNSTGHFINSVRKDEALQEQAHCFIPAPGRQHLASKLRGKDINEYSSGASSSVSELDDADKEVRNLTAKSFRSLACPYFDAIDLRTSSESSVSEHGLSFNRWSAVVDWNYGSIDHEHGTLETTKHTENKNGNIITSKNRSSESAKKLEVTSKFQSERDEAKAVNLTEMLSISCNMETALASKSTHSISGSCSTANVEITKPARSGYETGNQPSEVTDGSKDTYQKAVVASSLLQNVISKKMQFEQVCMERFQVQQFSPCPQYTNSQNDNTDTKNVQRQASETGSGESTISLEELGDIMHSVSHLSEEEANSHGATGEACLESPGPSASTSKAEPCESCKGKLPCLQSSAFKTWKDSEHMIPGSDTKPTDVTVSTERGNERKTKVSHLYVPSSHPLPKERDLVKSAGEGGQGETSAGSDCSQGKAKEITICLQNMKENNSNQVSIASLLTPSIGHNPVKSHILSVSDKAPHFMVRDFRDNKWKLHTPIHQVRDVRKLVKSSYRFVSLEKPAHKSGPSVSYEEIQDVKKEPDKSHFPSPMVIKFQSVNTSSTQQSAKVSSKSSQETETAREVSPCSRNERMRRVTCTKQMDPKLVRQKMECKLTNQAALEKLKAAVKTMEQLYVFDRNEWKRKAEAPRVVTDSHILSLITSEEHRVAGKTNSEDKQVKMSNLESHTERMHMKPVVQTGISKTTKHDLCDSRCMMGPEGCLGKRTSVSVGAHQNRPFSTGEKSSKGPLCLKFSQSKARLEDRGRVGTPASETVSKSQHFHPPMPDSQNYLTIPVKSSPTDHKIALQPCPQQTHQTLQRSPVVTDSWAPESPTATIMYHHTAHPQLVCITPPLDIPAPNTQRKLLLDPSTGQYYLVDNPVPLQPATQRIFYPESGRYLDVPMSVTPVPISPLTLSPAYPPPTYFVYRPPLLPLHSHTQSSTCLEGDALESGARSLYLAPPGAPTSGAKQVISISSQQGPRIIAPPSFDGTTMSFVVEHR
ncbi:uncharacterized protein C4orf54-like [Hoplias malabaricus]|uniref:uncharacterized protein C4orf54-like n=1 Tax=Hoplias malabaricus TaxID=27720 RepID=UPI0034620DEB